MSNYGNMANMPRPEVDFGQQTQQGIAQLAAANNQRAAALAQVLDQGKLYKLAGATNQNIGQPQYDPMEMMQNANSMVNAGWQNPFANIAGFGVQPPAPPSNPVADLFQRNGIQAPPGFMDQLLGVLGQQAPPPQFGGGYEPVSPPRTGGPFPPEPPVTGPQRYTPVPPGSTNGVFDPTQQIVNANRFVSAMERTNPSTWTDQQWSDYEAANRDSLVADRGGYFRRDGQVYRSFGNAVDPDGSGRIRAPELINAAPRATMQRGGPGQAQPIQPQSQGTPYGASTSRPGAANVGIDWNDPSQLARYGHSVQSQSEVDAANARMSRLEQESRSRRAVDPRPQQAAGRRDGVTEGFIEDGRALQRRRQQGEIGEGQWILGQAKMAKAAGLPFQREFNGYTITESPSGQLSVSGGGGISHAPQRFRNAGAIRHAPQAPHRPTRGKWG
jgi:hypothetical protein